MVLKLNDRYTVVLGAIGTGASFSFRNANEVVSFIAGCLTVCLVGLKLGEKIRSFFQKRKTTKHHNKMRNTIRHTSNIVAAVLLSTIIFLVFSGCTTANPNREPTYSNPATGAVSQTPQAGYTVTNVPPAYVPDSGRINAISDGVRTASKFAEPFNPYASITSPAIELGLAAFASISTIIAGIQSKKKNKAEAVNQTFANAVVSAGANDAVLKKVENSDHFAAIADHINEAKPL